jgi:hypothetical protein
MNMDNEAYSELIRRFRDGDATAEEDQQLEALLLNDAAFREQYLRYVNIDLGVRSQIRKRSARSERAPVENPAVRSFWLKWPPVSAAAAGLAVGLLSTSMLFGYVMPSLQKVTTLLWEDFESGPSPLAENWPVAPGQWSGDYSELSGVVQGVAPETGSNMLRFLRADYEGRHLPESFSSDVFRLVDVRRYQQSFAEGESVAQLAAKFNAAPFPEGDTYTCTLTIFALDDSLVGNELLKESTMISTESLAYSRSSKLEMDRDPATWQKLSNELRVPPQTQYLMIRLGISNDTKAPAKQRDSFPGHFADSVELVFADRPEIATR